MKLPLYTLTMLTLMHTSAAAAQVAGVELPAPWPAGDVADVHWGVSVPDPYRELENVKDERVQKWLRAQAEATDKVLARLPGRDALLARIQALEAEASGVTTSLSRTRDGRLFFLRRNPGEQQFRLILRESVDAAPVMDRVLVDPDALSAAAGKPVAILDYAPSPDGRLLAYALASGGSEIGSLQVVEVASGKPVMAPIDRIRYAAATWLPDGSGFFYARLRQGYEALPATERFGDRTTHLRLLDGSDRAVFSASLLSELKLPPIAQGRLFVFPGKALVGAWVTLGVDRNAMLFVTELDALKSGRATWRKLVDSADEVSQMALGSEADGAIYLRSAKGAPRFQVLKLKTDALDLKAATLAVAQGEGVITSIDGARDGLYVARREGVSRALWRRAAAGSWRCRCRRPATSACAMPTRARTA